MEFSRGMRMVQLSRTRVNSPEKFIMVERIKPPDEIVDKTVFVCKWKRKSRTLYKLLTLLSMRTRITIIMILMAVDTKDDVKSKENIEAVIENENDYKNQSYLMVLDTETEVNDKRNLIVVNMGERR